MTKSERSAYFRYRLLARFAEILPVSGIRIIATAGGWLGPKFNARQANLVRSNLHRVTNSEPSDKDVRDAYASYVRYWLNAFRLPVLPKSYLDRVFTIEGLEHVEAAKAMGKGAILAVPHMGNWDVAGAWFGSNGFPLVVVAERLHPEELHVWFEQFRNSLGMQVIVNGPDVARQITTALRNNEIVALLCDRDVDGTGGEYELFGEVTKLPKGPALLALRTGAALLPAAVYEQGTNFHAVVKAPIGTVRGDEGLRADVDRVTKDLVSQVESFVRRAPTQWHVFQPNWPSDRTDNT